ncbi:MAG: hypothetical protein FRX49_10100 [Trebouxia sp. A1-2]|nr:MAG: hypothetical protein FRX49_10100 [Trebouxia sp. A1-2]
MANLNISTLMNASAQRCHLCHTRSGPLALHGASLSRSPASKPFISRPSRSRCIVQARRGSSSRQDAQDDMIPSDAEVVPVEGVYRTGNRQKIKGQTALVAGATGGVGSRVVQCLVNEGMKVRALVRDYTKVNSDLYTKNVEVIKGDVYQYSTLPAAMKGCDFVVCATGSTDRLNPFGPFNVDYQGTKNLIAAATQAKVKKFVLVTSIGTDDPLFPLNLFFGVLFFKKRAEEELQRSGIDYTIVRPGKLNAVPDRQREGGIVMAGPDTFGLPPRRSPGSILRRQVAEICVDALSAPAATNKVVEVVADQNEIVRPAAELFAGQTFHALLELTDERV